jgi:hypothetical protein
MVCPKFSFFITKNFYVGELPKFQLSFFFISLDGPIKMIDSNKEKKELEIHTPFN